jgi:transcriptional regulator with XRE-family HTH domain
MFAIVAVRYKTQLGEAIKRRREELGMTQKDLADAANIAEPQTVSRWERGQNLPSDMERVAEALQTTIEDLMRGIKPPDRRTARKLSLSIGDSDQGAILLRIESKLDQLLAREESLIDGIFEDRDERDGAQGEQEESQLPDEDQPPGQAGDSAG